MLLSALQVSASGLRAESKSVEATASNIANVRTSSRLSEAEAEKAARAQGTSSPSFNGYKPFQVDRFALSSGGVRAEFRESDDFYVPVYDPSDVNADETGVTALPNVDLGREIVNLTMAHNAYSANLAAFRTASDMLGELLDDET